MTGDAKDGDFAAFAELAPPLPASGTGLTAGIVMDHDARAIWNKVPRHIRAASDDHPARFVAGNDRLSHAA
jgi:hypothetical protein